MCKSRITFFVLSVFILVPSAFFFVGWKRVEDTGYSHWEGTSSEEFTYRHCIFVQVICQLKRGATSQSRIPANKWRDTLAGRFYWSPFGAPLLPTHYSLGLMQEYAGLEWETGNKLRTLSEPNQRFDKKTCSLEWETVR